MNTNPLKALRKAAAAHEAHGNVEIIEDHPIDPGAQIETEIARLAHDSMLVRQYAQPNHRLPDYVKHVEGVSQIGGLSAEAILKDIEDTVTQINDLGQMLVDGTKMAVQEWNDCKLMIEDIQKTIGGCREHAKKMFETIQETAKHNADVRKRIGLLLAAIGNNPESTGA